MNKPLSLSRSTNFAPGVHIECFNGSNQTITTIDLVRFFLKNQNAYSKDNPFYIIDLTQVVNQYYKWLKYMPRVIPYYAVKCNPDPIIIRLLYLLGCNFDCASKNEIAQIFECNEGTSTVSDSDRVIFANPIKSPDHIKYAKSVGVNLMTFDSINELYKIKLHYSSANLVLRIKIDDSKSLCRFGTKFGAETDELETIFNTAEACSLNVIGVSFHVGSNCYGLESYVDAIRDASKVFKLAKKHGFDFSILDIGGGFPGYETELSTSSFTFEDIASTINKAIDEYFNVQLYPNLKIIAEPGRYMVASSHILVSSVIGKKENKAEFKYYISDGVYSSYNCIHYDHITPKILVEKDVGVTTKLFKSTVFGPTCDSMDTIDTNCMLPELNIGDWVYSKNMGAYTISAASNNFNGFLPAVKYYCMQDAYNC
jgi:ornithine decarboxylase